MTNSHRTSRCPSSRPLALCFTMALLLSAPGVSAEAGATPWDLDSIDGFPEALSLEVDHRNRFELLNDPFHQTSDSEQSVFVLRTRVRAGVQIAPWLRVAGEFQDSRALDVDSSLVISTGVVNTTELLQGYVEFSGKGLFGGEHMLRAGRLTMDIGDRRLVARNRFRNTSNSFTGVDWRWKDDDAHELRLFWTMPVQRRPAAPSRTRDNDYRWDRQSSAVQFFGAFAAMDLPGTEAGGRLELFAYGLLEKDEPKRITRDRNLGTIGYRLFRKPASGELDYQLESVIQFGKSHGGVAPASPKLDHLAHFHHIEVGYRFDVPAKLRVALQYDFASGDKDPTDGKNHRFDTLYGARRFDFGPTSIYGPFARSNLNSPGVRIQLEPAPGFTSFIAVRPFWRATSNDVWTTSASLGTSTSSKYIGTQTEIRVRWNIVPKNVLIEAGYAHLFKGHVADSGTAPKGDSDYFYSQLSLAF